MAEIENLLLEHLRALRADVSLIREDMRDMRLRLTSLEQGQATIIRQTGALIETDARLQVGLDRLADRVERIEHRLDIVEAP